VPSTGGRTSKSQEAEPALIRVAIIEDQPDIREGLGVLIHGTPGYRVVGSFRSMEEARGWLVKNQI
jgi:DNA-binding NarL/FixJ family response regulator